MYTCFLWECVPDHLPIFKLYYLLHVVFLCLFYTQMYSHCQINTASILFFDLNVSFAICLFLLFIFMPLESYPKTSPVNNCLPCVPFWYYSFVVSDLIFSFLKHFKSVTCIPTFVEEAILPLVNCFDAVVGNLWVSDGISIFSHCFVCDIVSTMLSGSLSWDWDCDASALFLLLVVIGCFGCSTSLVVIYEFLPLDLMFAVYN